MKKCFSILLLFCLSFNYSYSQEDFCMVNSTSTSSAIPNTGTFRILIVLCKFSDDNFNQSPHTDLWPSTLNSMPSWGPNLVSSTVQQSYSNPSMSGYFKTMSNGLYDVIGDVVFYQPQYEQCYYSRVNGRHIGYLTEEILTAINPVVNFANYDNNNDGKVDMIMICFRFADTYHLDLSSDSCHIPGKRYQGISGLTGFRETFGSGTTLTLDGKTISASTLTGSGTFQNGVTDLHGGLPVMLHEFGHYLFGGVHFVGVGHHGLMDGAGTGVMSSFERIKMGWITPIPITSNAVDSILTDALTTHKVYKLSIPGTSDYFLIDNHQRVSFYENSWLKYNGGPIRSPGTGLLITHSYPDIESAFGRWNWKKVGGLYVYPFEKETPNRNFGEDKLNLRQKSTTSGIKDHPEFLGASDDYFNIGYNQIFSPWSNPSTYPDIQNLCVELLQKDQYNNIHVNFYINNPLDAPPSKPQNLSITCNTNSRPLLKWSRNQEPDLTKYKIYKKVTEEWGFQYLTETTDTFYIDNTEQCITGPPIANERIASYRITAVDNTNKESVPSDAASTRVSGPPMEKALSQNKVLSYQLHQNHPNPFNPVTRIKYAVSSTQNVELKVFDLLGREVATLVNEPKQAGEYEIEFDANKYGLSSGVYLYQLTAGSFTSTKKFVYLR